MLVRLAPSVLVVSLLACSAPSSTEAPPEATSGAARAEDDTGGGETPRARDDDAEPAPSSTDREAPREPTQEAADPEPSPRSASESSPDADPSEGGTSGESGPEAEAAPLVAGPPTPLTLACGRAQVELPPGWEIVADEAQSCENPGYPLRSYRARGIAGAESTHLLRQPGCEVRLRASELTPEESASEQSVQHRVQRLGPGTLAPRTPEGTAFLVSLAGADTCAEASRAALQASLEASLTVAPLRDGSATTVHADLSSSGHGLRVELPPGWWLVNLGGMADAWETRYMLRGPGEAYATFYTSWAVGENVPREFDPERFSPEVLGPRPRWRQGDDPWAWDWAEEEPEPCQTTYAGPEPRLDVEIFVCGPRAERRRIHRALRAMRFTRPRR